MLNAKKLIIDVLKRLPSIGADIAVKTPFYGTQLKIVITVFKHTYQYFLNAAEEDRANLAKEIRQLTEADILDALEKADILKDLQRGQAELLIGAGNLEHGQETLESQLSVCLNRLAESAQKQNLLYQDIHGAILASLEDFATQAVETVRRELASVPVLDEALRKARDTEAANFERLYLRQVSDSLGRLDVLGLHTQDTQAYALDTAWISLTVTGGRSVGSASCATEDFLLANRQAAIRGAAGSGKTTVLQWLAHRCTIQGTDDAPNPWFGAIPILIRLRRCGGGTPVLPPRAEWVKATLPEWGESPPTGWVDDCIDRGRAIILVDGLDELAAARRETVWSELKELARRPIRICLTSRNLPSNTEFHKQWSPWPNMADAELHDLTDDQVTTLIRNWHAAVVQEERERGTREEDWKRIAALEGPLVKRLGMREHRMTRSLASTPLLCAAICVVNRENEGLPVHSQCDLFEKCCAALVHRRDRIREIPPEEANQQEAEYLAGATANQWLSVHSRLALAMLTNPPKRAGDDPEGSQLEADKRDVLQWLNDAVDAKCKHVRGFMEARDRRCHEGEKLPSGAEALLDHMQVRRSLIREIAGRYDFHHRSLRDYLAARGVALARYEKQMLEHVADDRWREVIRLYPGTPMAGVSNGDDLIKDLVVIAENQELSNSRRLRAGLLAIACNATRKGPGDEDDIERAQEALKASIERLGFSVDDAELLAALGERVLPWLRLTKSNLRKEARALSVARLLRLIDVPAAQDAAVKALRATQYKSVRAELEQWANLNPLRLAWIVEEVQTVRSEPRGVVQRISDLSPLIGMAGMTRLHLDQTAVTDLSPLAGLTALTVLNLSQTGVTDLSPLARLAALEVINLNQTGATNLSPLAGLTALQVLSLRQTEVTDISPLADLAALDKLYLGQTGVRDLAPLEDLRRLWVYIDKDQDVWIPSNLKNHVFREE